MARSKIQIGNTTEDLNDARLPSSFASANAGQILLSNGQGSAIFGNVPYTTTAPTEANADGLKFCVLTSEPATRYSGWVYFIVTQ